MHICGVSTALNGEKGSGNIEENIIRLLYYRIGEPKAMQRKLGTFLEMQLESKNGQRPLMSFAKEVIAWQQQINRAPDLQSRFPLYRLKMMDEEGIWVFEGLKRVRPVDSVVLSGDQMNMILKEVGTFRTERTKLWYYRHGLPYRRSFLFFGPPGTGKTSTVRVIASKFSLSCCTLSVNNSKFSTQTFGDALSSLPSNSLLVLEDVDALFNVHRSHKTENELSFSGLLNALDGLVSVEGLITVMKTNHIERLEKALIRGGRVDRRFLFGPPNSQQLVKLFKSFYPGCKEETAQHFAGVLCRREENDEARAISTLQQLFIDMKEHSAEECLAGMGAFLKQHFPQRENENNVLNAT